MAATAGRLMGVYLDNTGGASYQKVGGTRSWSYSIDTEEVDGTNADSTNQKRELVANAGVGSLAVTLSGVDLDDAYVRQAQAYAKANTIRNWQLVCAGWGTLNGPFQVSKFANAGEYNGVMTYDITLASAGDYTFTGS